MKLSLAQANEYGRRVLMAQGVPEDIARDVAEHLVESDRVGYTSHGLSILTNYRRVLSEGLAQADGRPELVNDRGAAARARGSPRSGFQCLPGPEVHRP